MTQQILHRLSTEFDINLDSVEQLRNSQNLMLIAFKVLYHQQNHFILSKLSGTNNKNDSFSKSQLNQSVISNQSNTTKAGNNVILINTLLKHIKSDKSLKLPVHIKELTFYNLLEEDQLLCQFIQWMIDQNQKNNKNQIEPQKMPPRSHQFYQQSDQNFQSFSSNRFRNIEIQSTKIKESQRFKTQQKQQLLKTQQKQGNELDNLYFASNLKQKLSDSPVNPQPENTDRIVRKGSFKLLKPKVMFSQQNNPDRQPKQLFQEKQISKKHNSFHQPDQLKEISMIESNPNQFTSNLNNLQSNHDQQISQLNDFIDEIVSKKIINTTPSMSRQQQNHRKTVPKNMAKPPLYRSSIKNKQNQLSEQKTIEQKLKKKNFFNFETSNQELVSNFNFQTVKNTFEQGDISKSYKLPQNQINENKMEEFYRGSSSQILFKKQNKNFYDLENNNIIEEDDSSNLQRTIQVEQRKQSSNQLKSKILNNSSLLKLKNHFLQKQLYSLDKQIQSQQIELKKSLQQQKDTQQNKTVFVNNSTQSLQNSRSRNDSFSSAKRSSRKVSKIQIKIVEDQVKQDIIDWLDSIHIINRSINTVNQITQRFSNGVKFVQLCNHYIGRGRAIPYFNNPKKNAEIHSNFSKVFEHLKLFSQFTHKQLLFAYQLFVPYPQKGSIWSLLEAIYKLFNKKGVKNTNIKSKDYPLNFKQQNYSTTGQNIKQKLEHLNHSSQNLSIKQNDLNFIIGYSGIKKQKSSSSFKNHSVSSTRKQSTFSKPIQFIPMIPDMPQHNDLIQQSQEPQENQVKNVLNLNQDGLNGNILTEGYKEKYLRRALDMSTSKDHSKSTKNFFSLQTPKKQAVSNNQHSFIGVNKSRILNNSIINRSSSKKGLESQIKRLQNSSQKINSIRNNSRKKAISKLPKVTLNMQMKVDRIINEYNLGTVMNQSNEINQFKKHQLFQDPIRNGTFINLLLTKLVSKQVRYIKLPQSIEHCRQNYNNIFGFIKNKYGQQLFQSFDIFVAMVEQILKGQINIFYAIAYQMVQNISKKQGQNYNSSNILQNDKQKFVNQCYSKRADTTIMNKGQMIRLYCKNYIQWVRLLQLTNPFISSLRIRSIDDLYYHISTGSFLYLLLQNPSVNMVYLNPQTISEKEANLKKVMVYMIQMKIFKREEFTNVHQIAQKNILVIENLIQKLIQYTVTKEWNYIDKNINTLKKILVQQLSPKKDQKNNLEIQGLGAITNNQPNYQGNQTFSQKNIMRNENLQFLNGNKLQQIQKNREKPQTKRQREQFEVEIPWMRKLGFTNCSLNLNNGILLCRLISKLTRTNIKFNQNIAHDAHISKPESLSYIKKALKLIPGCRIDELDVYNADERKTLEIYNIIKDKFRNNYQMGKVVSVR